MVNDIDEDPAASVVAEIEARGGRAVAGGTDVGSIEGGRAAVATTIDAFGRVDIVVNNAGFAHGGSSVADPIEAELDALIAVHLKAALGTMAAAFPDMRARGWGRIVNTVSEVALDSRLVGSMGYGAAKAALWSATLVAAAEGAPHGITVNGISPGARTRLNADLLDAGFRGCSSAHLDLDPAHVAAVVAYLVSDEAADITGRIIHAAGGHIREYTTTRSSRTGLATRIRTAVSANLGSISVP